MITSFHNKSPRGYPRGRCLCILLRAVSNETNVLNIQIGLRALLAPLGCVPCIFRPRWTLPPAALNIICLMTFTRGRGGAYAFTLSRFHFPPLGGLLRVCRNNFTISAARSLVTAFFSNACRALRWFVPCLGVCLPTFTRAAVLAAVVCCRGLSLRGTVSPSALLFSRAPSVGVAVAVPYWL